MSTDELRTQVAAAKGIPDQHAHRLVGTTREELEADADQLRSDLRLGHPGGRGQTGLDEARRRFGDRVNSAARLT